jgi:uncharacterized protein with PIN domain
MKTLFTFCEEWEHCKNKDLRELFERREVEGEDFKWPSEEKLEDLNKICSSCKYPLELQEEKCPVCGGELITPDVPVPSQFEEANNTRYFYRCMNCKRLLYSFREIS